MDRLSNFGDDENDRMSWQQDEPTLREMAWEHSVRRSERARIASLIWPFIARVEAHQVGDHEVTLPTVAECVAALAIFGDEPPGSATVGPIEHIEAQCASPQHDCTCGCAICENHDSERRFDEAMRGIHP